MSPTLEERFEGAVLGAAIGDALGHPTEFLNTAQIRTAFPPNGVTGYALWWERDGKRFAPYTDDTQMAEIVLRTLVELPPATSDLDVVMIAMGRGFAEWRTNPQGGHRAPGRACLAGAEALERGAHWSKAGGARAGGCGSVMRAYPFGLLLHDEPDKARSWAAEHSKLTHRDPIALAACAAIAEGMCAAIEDHEWDAATTRMVRAAAKYSDSTGEMMMDAWEEGKNGAPPELTLQHLQGWAAHEAIAAAIYVIARHQDDPKAAILEGANAPGDSDSIATLVGALMGARFGIQAWPEAWVRDVERSEELRALDLQASRVAQP